MDDLISRQAAIDALDFEIVHMTAYCDGKNEGNPLAQYNKGLEDGKKAIEALPSAQQEQRWIPCSERLPDHPENDDYYLVTIQCEHYDGWDDYVTGFAEWTKHGWEELSCYIGQIKVVAWMPLPESYKGGEQDG